jgi:hypothetical protein
MPAPSPLTIATQSVQRLVKEDSYYRKELAQQTERVKKLEEDLKTKGESADENAEFMLKQEVCTCIFLTCPPNQVHSESLCSTSFPSYSHLTSLPRLQYLALEPS